MRATSRWLVKRTFPCFENRTRYLTPPHRPADAEGAGGLGAEPPGIDRRRLRRRGSSSHEHQLTGALGAAGRWGGRGNDVLDAVAGACAAVVARRPPAIGEPQLRERVAPVLPQEVLVQAGG